MHNQIFSNTLVLILVTAVGITSSGCRSSFPGIPSCGCAEETCDSPSCGIPSCGCAEETCDSPSCGTPSCGCAEASCEMVGCGSEIGCKNDQCGWLKKLLGGFKLCDCAGCDGELYWSEWHNDPPGCEPCDSCGNWTRPRGAYQTSYRILPGEAIEPSFAREAEQNATYLAPTEETSQTGLPMDDPAVHQLIEDPNWSRDDLTKEKVPTAEDAFEIALEREMLVR